MVGKIVAVMLGIIYVLFFLSVIAPTKSKRKFWLIIRKIRAGMDFVSYWFFNICAILTIVYVAWMSIYGWAEAYGF